MLSVATSNWEWENEHRNTGCLTIAHCSNKMLHKCSESPQVMTVAMSIKPGSGVEAWAGVANHLGKTACFANCKCSLSRQASIMYLRHIGCFTSAVCRHKHQSWSGDWIRCCTSAHSRHQHQSWSCEELDALQVLTVAPSIHHGAPKKLDDLPMPTVVTSNSQEAIIERTERVGVGVGIQKNYMLYKWSLWQQNAWQVLTVATCINHGSSKNSMLYKCWLSQ